MEAGGIVKVLVTGGAGFLGRHFIAELQQRPEVTQIVSVDPDPMNVSMDFAKGAHLHVRDDLINFLQGRPAASDEYDLVIHCAAVSPHRVGIDTHKGMLIWNLLLDSSLFDWAMHTQQGRVLYLSSSAIYPAWRQQKTEDKYQENLWEGFVDLNEMIGAPFDDYGWIKWMGEKMACQARQCGLPVTVVRPFSGFGEDQSSDFPFPAIVARARTGDLTVWGPPGQTRDWIHVDDLVKGALAVAESSTEEPVNLCTGIGTEIGDLAKMVWDEAATVGGPPRPEVTYDEDAPTGVFHRVGDPARMLTHYTPQISLEEGIRRALAWA